MSVLLFTPFDAMPSARADEDRRIWQRFRHHSRTFSLAARLLPRTVRLPVATLYLFCRRVDTLADERPLEIGSARALAELRTLEEQLEATLSGRPPAGLLWRRLHELDGSFGLAPQPLFELIDGARWDFSGRGIADEADLVAYSNLVGGSVGAMLLPFLVKEKSRCAELEASARTLGIAMQITNIVRDVGEDARELERVYLPRTWMAEHACPEDALFVDVAPMGATGGAAAGRLARSPRSNGSRNGHTPAALPEGYPALLERTMNAAEERYLHGFEGIDALPLRARLGIRAAARMYREILNEVRALGYNNLYRRAFAPLPRKLGFLAFDGYARRKARLLARHAAAA